MTKPPSELSSTHLFHTTFLRRQLLLYYFPSLPGPSCSRPPGICLPWRRAWKAVKLASVLFFVGRNQNMREYECGPKRWKYAYVQARVQTDCRKMHFLPLRSVESILSRYVSLPTSRGACKHSQPHLQIIIGLVYMQQNFLVASLSNL